MQWSINFIILAEQSKVPSALYELLKNSFIINNRDIHFVFESDLSTKYSKSTNNTNTIAQ